MNRHQFVAVFEDRLLYIALSGLVLGPALVATGVSILDSWAVTILPLVTLLLGVLFTDIGVALIGLRFTQPRIGHRLVMSASGAIAGTILAGAYLSTVTEFILGPPVVAGGLSVAVVIGFVVASVERGM